MNDRRYDIDWLRVIAIGLLLVYHTAIGFQPWGFLLGFITNDKPAEALWVPMAMLNVWRIPLLFFISGMGLCFAARSRNRGQLLLERSRRILIPFLFGVFVVVPMQVLIVQGFYRQSLSYVPNPAHLWFLGNIFIYVVLLLPALFWVKRKEKVVAGIRKLLSNPLSLLIVVGAFVAEVWLVKPAIYELYAITWHGFFLGMLAFVFGFCFALGGAEFQAMLLRWRWLFLAVAVGLYAYRLVQPGMRVNAVQLVVESCGWIFSVFAFGFRYLNRPGRILRYLSQAAYPVYIVHMIFLYLASELIYPLQTNAYLKFTLALALTIGGSLLLYECVIRRIGVIRLLFGLPLSGNGVWGIHAKCTTCS